MRHPCMPQGESTYRSLTNGTEWHLRGHELISLELIPVLYWSGLTVQWSCKPQGQSRCCEERHTVWPLVAVLLPGIDSK